MIICPSCGKKFSGHDDLHGKKVACPKCQKHFIADIAARPETQPTEHEKTPPTSSDAENRELPTSLPDEVRAVILGLMLKLQKWLKPQDYVLAAGLFLFILAGLFPPWLRVYKSTSTSIGSHWLWYRGGRNVHIDTVNLFIEWFVIGVVTAVVYFIVWNRLQPAKPPPHVDD